jgi:hypothetical protein
VRVATDDPAAPLDLPAWCHLTGHHYLGPIESHLGRAFAIRLTAGAKVTDARRPWNYPAVNTQRVALRQARSSNPTSMGRSASRPSVSRAATWTVSHESTFPTLGAPR